jgi:hypothetical protein
MLIDPEPVTADDVIVVVSDLLTTRGYLAARSTRSPGRAAALLGSFVYADDEMPADARRGTAELDRAINLLMPMLDQARFDVNMIFTKDEMDRAESLELIARCETMGRIISLLCDLRDANKVL